MNAEPSQFPCLFPLAPLCIVCRKIFSVDPTSLSPGSPEANDEYLHHENWGGVQSSVDSGCYICSHVKSVIISESQSATDSDRIETIYRYTPATFYMVYCTGEPGTVSRINIRVNCTRKIVFFCMYRFEGVRIYPMICIAINNFPDFPSPTFLSLRTDSPSTTSAIRKWLQKCTAEHSCQLATALDSDSERMPSRLLDLSDARSDHPTWKLCIPAQDHIQHEEYMTISYRW